MALPGHMNLRYTLIHAAFWAGYGIIWAFIAPLMEYYGFSTSVIGVVTAASALLSVVVSPLLAQLVSGSDKLLERHGAVGLTVLSAALCVLAAVFDTSTVLLAAVFLLVGTIQILTSPFINTMGLAAAKAGYGVIYGFSRGIGSVSYAACVLVFGFLIERFAPSILLPCYIVLALLCAVALHTFRHPFERQDKTASVRSGFGAFAVMRAYPRFTMALLGGALFYSAHNIYNIYLNSILARVGASESAMGIALAISAAVELPAMTFVSKFEKKLSCRLLFTVAASIVLIRLAVYAFSDSVGLMYAVQVLQFFEYGFFLPATVYYVDRHLPREVQLQGQSMIHVASNGLGAAFGSLVGGVLIDTPLGIHAALLFAALCAAIALPLFLVCEKK